MKFLKDKKGLTIIELLAVIIVMCLLVGITVGIILTIVRKVKLNSYKVTINEVESNAYEYTIENSDRLLFVSDEGDNNPTVEYQCISVQNLIDYGFLDNNVINSAISDDDKVIAENSIYVERNTLTKAVTRQEYVRSTSDEIIKKRCKRAAIGEITFSVVPSMDTWAKSKVVTINYKVSNLNDINKMNEITYTYTFEGPHEDLTGDNNKLTTRKVKVSSEKELIADINYKGVSFKQEKIKIEKIDNEGPTVEFKNTTQTVQKEVTIPITIKDIGSGVDFTTVDKGDFTITIDGQSPTEYSIKKVDNSDDSGKSGKYEITIKESRISGQVVIEIEKDKILDKVKNGNSKIILETNTKFDNSAKLTFDANGGKQCNPKEKILVIDDEYGELCKTTNSDSGLVFDAWYTKKEGGKQVNEHTVIKKDTTIYAHWKKKEYTITYNSNSISTTGKNETKCDNKSFSKKDGDKYGTLCNPDTITGYDFKGWHTHPTNDSKVSNTTIAHESRTIYGHWAKKSYTITYDSNGGSKCNPTSFVKEHGTAYGNLCQPTRAGFVFGGWNTEKNGSGTKVDESTIATEARTIYAQWNAKKITFAGGSRTIGYSDTIDQSISLRTDELAKEGSGSFTYAITDGDSSNNFNISGTAITVNKQTAPKTYTLTLTATDNTTKATANANFTITVGIYQAIDGKGNNISYYNSLDAAYRAIRASSNPSAGTIKALGNYDNESSEMTVEKSVTIDLNTNGKTIRFKKDNSRIKTYGTLNLTYAGTLDCELTTNCISQYDGNININNSNLTISSANGVSLYMESGTTNMSNGTLTSSNTTINQTGGTFYLNGGTIKSTGKNVFAITVGTGGTYTWDTVKKGGEFYLNKGGTITNPNGGGILAKKGSWIQTGNDSNYSYSGTLAFIRLSEGTVYIPTGTISVSKSYAVEETGGNMTIEGTAKLNSSEAEILYFSGGWANILVEGSHNPTFTSTSKKRPIMSSVKEGQVTLEGANTSNDYTTYNTSVGVVYVGSSKSSDSGGTVNISQKTFNYNNKAPFITVDNGGTFNFSCEKGGSQVFNIKGGTLIEQKGGSVKFSGGTMNSYNNAIILNQKGGEFKMSTTDLRIQSGYEKKVVPGAINIYGTTKNKVIKGNNVTLVNVKDNQ